MLRMSTALVFSAVATTTASAQQPQKYVPFVVEEQDAKNLRAFLDEQQMKIGLPILQWMDGLENRAIAAKAKAEAADEKEKKKEPDGK